MTTFHPGQRVSFWQEYPDGHEEAIFGHLTEEMGVALEADTLMPIEDELKMVPAGTVFGLFPPGATWDSLDEFIEPAS